MADQRSGLLFLFLCWAVIKAENPPSNLVVGKVPTNPQNGGSASLNCQATAATSYEWFATDLNGYSKDISGSKYIHQASTGQLIISNLQYGQDDGYFYCVAKNNGGRVRSSRVVFQVSYLKLPSNIGASTTSAVEGGGLVFAYPEVESYPKPTFTWTKDNNALQEDQRISISAAGNLYIGNVDTGDLALYKSTVRNSVTESYYNRGPNSISFTVRDPVPPQSEIILGPINQVAISGQTSSVVFECFGSGRPMPSISWRKNGQTVTSGSKFSFDQYKKRLTIRNPSKADEGDYECHVTSSLSPQPRTSKANLTVFDQPTFRVTPSNINKYPQEAAIFACNATGIPKPTITWFHNGAKVVPSPGGRIQISSKKELKFTSLQSGDAGTVQCVATNDAGEAISAATLNIKTLDVWIDVPPKNTHALINETVELKCVGRGTPTPSISWQKNDVPINFQSNPRYLKMSSGSLRISMSKKSDSGKYTCVATNSRGNRKANATLTVFIETLITNPLPSQITAIKGAPKDLHCTVQSDPAISVHWRWTKDGSPVDTSRMTLLNDGTLRINTVQENDAGTYVCRVESVAGNATTSGTLSVQETPLAPSTPVVSNIQPTSVRLSWFPYVVGISNLLVMIYSS